MKVDAEIIDTVVVSDNLDYMPIHVFSWTGGKVAHINIFHLFRLHIPEKVGHAFQLGNLRLRIVYVDWDRREVYVSQDGWKSKVWAILYPVVNGIGWVLHRFTLTAWVWRLTRFVVPGRIITWRDVYPWPWIERGWGWLNSRVASAWKTIVATLCLYRDDAGTSLLKVASAWETIVAKLWGDHGGD